jgi:molybdate transport system substrate-binding protein
MTRWLLAALLLWAPAQAADVTVLGAGAIIGVAEAVAPGFEAATGHKVTLRTDTSGGLARRIKGGEAFDVVMMPPAALDALGAATAPGTRVALASVGVGIGVRTGAPPPDISTVDAFRAAMLGARAVAYVDPASGGTSGIYIAKLFRDLGIAEAMAPKSVLTQGGLAAAAVADGRAEIALQQASEIMAVPGVALIGMLPDAVQMRTVYAGALAAGAVGNQAATEFLAAMQAPPAREAMRARGLAEP